MTVKLRVKSSKSGKATKVGKTDKTDKSGKAAKKTLTEAAKSRPAARTERKGAGTGSRTASSVRAAEYSVPLTVTVFVLVAITLCAAGGTLVSRLYSAQRYDEAAAQEALRVAPGYVEKVISYDYRTLESDVRDARKNLTGKFLGEYDRSMSKVTPTLVGQQAIQEARAAKAGVQEASSTEVAVLVFSQRMTTKLDREEPQVYQDRILVTLTKVRDRWLISQMRYLV